MSGYHNETSRSALVGLGIGLPKTGQRDGRPGQNFYRGIWLFASCLSVGGSCGESLTEPAATRFREPDEFARSSDSREKMIAPWGGKKPGGWAAP